MVRTKRVLKNFFQISLIAFQMLNAGCFIFGSTQTEFKSQVPPNDRSPKQKAWSWTNLIDYTVVDSNNFDSNVINTGVTNRYPMSVIASSNTDFSILMTRSSNAGNTVVKGFITQPSDYLGNVWGQTGSSYIQLDPGTTSVMFQRPMSVVDSYGNVHSIILSPPALAGRNSVYHTWKATGGSNWTTPRDVTDVDVVQTALPRTTALAVNSENVLTMAFCQNNLTYYNQYEINVGYRFSTATDGLTTTQSVDSGMSCHSTDYGMDLAFEKNDVDGILVTSSAAQTIQYKMYDGHVNGWSSTAVATIAGASTDRFPRVFIDEDGNIQLFFYRNVAGSNADLYYANGTVASGMNSATQFDSSTGSGSTKYIPDTIDPMPPIISSARNNKAIVLFIKSDGTSNRLWLSEYQGSNTWSAPVTVDAGSSIGDVQWADAAINDSGQIVIAYSSGSGTIAEHVYARYRDQGTWKTANIVSTYSGTQSLVAPNRLRPSVAISANGNAMVTFTHYIGGVRRSFAVSYHE